MSVDPIASRRFAEGLSTHLEDYLAAWKSSIADARREIDQILTGIGEKIPAQAKPLFPEDIVSLLLEDVMPPPVAPQKIIEKVVEKVVERVEVPVPTGGADWSLIRGSLCTIESARTQVDILSRFLSEANAHASRVALLVLRNDRLTGWKGVGFDGSGGRDDAIKAVDLGTNDDPFVAEVLKRERTMFASPPPDGPLRRALGGKAPSKTVLIPMVIRDRLAGLLVADELPGEDGRVNEAALEILTFVTGLTVDLLAARKKIPSPTLTPTGESILRFGPPPAAPAPAVVTPAMPFDIPSAKPAPLSVATDPAFMTVAAPSIKLPEPKKTVAPPPAPPVDTKRKLTDTSEALRALEESAAGKKKSEISDFEVPKFVRPEPAPAVEPPKPRIVPAAPAAPAAPTPPPVPAHPAAPVMPPLQGGEVTMAFESLRGPQAHPPAPPMRPPAPPAPMPAPAAAPPAPTPAVLRPPVAVPEPPKAPAAPAPAAAAPSALPAADALGGAGVAPMAPPAGFVPRSRVGGRQDDPRRAAEDARRLARLLISEIKLYNEKKVQEGKASGDIYERLKDDIERSRQVFNERVPESVRREADYFHEEMVRILADGKPDALGPIN